MYLSFWLTTLILWKIRHIRTPKCHLVQNTYKFLSMFLVSTWHYVYYEKIVSHEFKDTISRLGEACRSSLYYIKDYQVDGD